MGVNLSPPGLGGPTDLDHLVLLVEVSFPAAKSKTRCWLQ